MIAEIQASGTVTGEEVAEATAQALRDRFGPEPARMPLEALVFTARTLGGGHYVTDNIFGLALGSAAGLLPWALHYKMAAPTPEADKTSHAKLTSVALTPDPSSSGAVLQFAGLW